MRDEYPNGANGGLLRQNKKKPAGRTSQKVPPAVVREENLAACELLSVGSFVRRNFMILKSIGYH